MKDQHSPSEVWNSGGMPGKRGRRPVILFGQVREDARVEMALVGDFGRPARILGIASGGCTALALMAGNVECVTAIDINPAQIKLLELKKHFIARLSYEELLFAVNSDGRPGYALIRDELDQDSTGFWDSRGAVLKRGLDYSGIADRNLARGARLFHLMGHGKSACMRFMRLDDVREQGVTMEKWWSNRRWKAAFSMGLSKHVLRLVFGETVTRQLPDDFADVIRKRFENAMTATPAFENPYLWQVFLNRYSGTDVGLPPWLQRDNYVRIRKNMKRLTVGVYDALDWLASAEDESLDIIMLSNILEIAPANYGDHLLVECKRVLAADGCVLIRHILPFAEDTFANGVSGFEVDVRLSAELKRLERGPFCTEICVMKLLRDSGT